MAEVLNVTPPVEPEEQNFQAFMQAHPGLHDLVDAPTAFEELAEPSPTSFLEGNSTTTGSPTSAPDIDPDDDDSDNGA